MKTKLVISFLFLLILGIIGCDNTVKKERQLVETEYGKKYTENKSISVELALEDFEDWRSLLRRTHRIACNDSLPKITLKTDAEIKTVYLHNPCWEGIGCLLIKEKNTIKIHNDSIGKFYEDLYPLDSLFPILKRDLENNGKDQSLSDSPDQLLIYVSYDKNGFENLPETLDKLTGAYKLISNKTDINIWLDQKVDIVPPPPPPLLEEPDKW